MRISIFGLGYVGCATGACLAEMGHHVLGVEPNPVKVGLIKSGKSPVVEPGLDDLIARMAASGHFEASTDCAEAIRASELVMISVGTPSRSNGSIDLRYIRQVCHEIGQELAKRSDYLTIVFRSTMLPGTVENVGIQALESSSGKKAGKDFGVCMNPEFLREGTSLHDFWHPPKTVIGQLDERSGEALATIYADLPGPLVRTPLRVAEMVKYVDNTFHALKVSFANEVGNICKEAGIDSHKVMDIFCLDTKLNLSPYYLKPGFSFGGSCLPKDLRALNHEAKMLDVETPVLNSILESNKRQTLKVINKILTFKGKTIGFLGLSFKGGTDDLRESPTVEVIEAVLGKGFTIKVYDRHVSLAKLMGANKDHIEREIPHISRLMCSSGDDLLDAADVIVVANRDDEFPDILRRVKPSQVIIDLVRIFKDGLPTSEHYYGICW